MPAGERAAETGDISNPDERPQSLEEPFLEDPAMNKKRSKKKMDEARKALIKSIKEIPIERAKDSEEVVNHILRVESLTLTENRRNYYIQ